MNEYANSLKETLTSLSYEKWQPHQHRMSKTLKKIYPKEKAAL